MYHGAGPTEAEIFLLTSSKEEEQNERMNDNTNERACRVCKRTEERLDEDGIAFSEQYLECEECDPDGKSDVDAIGTVI